MSLRADNQTPQLEVGGPVNPSHIFLTKEGRYNTESYPLVFINDQWHLECGAIHGLPTRPQEWGQIMVGLFRETEEVQEDLIKIVHLRKVHLKESIIDFPEGEKDVQYRGEIFNGLNVELINLRGAKEDREAFLEEYKRKPSPSLRFIQEADYGTFTLEVGQESLLIFEAGKTEMLHGIHGFNVNYIIETLNSIIQWQRLKSLENNNSPLKTSLKIAITNNLDKKEFNEVETDIIIIIIIDHPKEYYENDNINNSFTIRVSNISNIRTLYVGLLILDGHYGVYNLSPCSSIFRDYWISLNNDLNFFVEPGEYEVIDAAKVIVSTESFDDYNFEVKSFEVGKMGQISKGFVQRSAGNRRKAEANWFTHTIIFNSIRNIGTIDHEILSLENGVIMFQPHREFSADVSLLPLRTTIKNVRPISRLADIFRGDNYEVLNFGAEKNQSDKSVIELHHISRKEALEQEPLEILIQKSLAEYEHVIPLTFDGEYIIPFGSSTVPQDKRTVQIEIGHLPSSPDMYRYNSNQESLHFCLLKLSAVSNRGSKLREFTFDDNGNITKAWSSPSYKIKPGEKALLIIPAFFGLPNEALKGFKYFLDEDIYDVLLIYYYEGLNTPLEQSASHLQSELLELGFSEDHALDIVAHSTGGLIARYLIQALRGSRFVQSLIMLGTPNRGLPSKSIDQAIELLRVLLAIAFNFQKPFIETLVASLSILTEIDRASISKTTMNIVLDQISVDSHFVRGLNRLGYQTPNTQYHFINYDTRVSENNSEDTYTRFTEKISQALGAENVGDILIDQAAKVEQITAPFPGKTPEIHLVGEHPLAYFEGESLAIIKKILS